MLECLSQIAFSVSAHVDFDAKRTVTGQKIEDGSFFQFLIGVSGLVKSESRHEPVDESGRIVFVSAI